MKFDKVDNIVDTLIETTKSGEVKWNEKLSNISKYNRKFERVMFTSINDTTFNITIKYILNEGLFELEKSPFLFILNKELPGGTICVNSDNIKNLREIIKDNFCQDMSPNSNDLDNILDSINKSISISKYIDDKLGGLLS